MVVIEVRHQSRVGRVLVLDRNDDDDDDDDANAVIIFLRCLRFR
jgi:hypothetical protein